MECVERSLSRTGAEIMRHLFSATAVALMLASGSACMSICRAADDQTRAESCDADSCQHDTFNTRVSWSFPARAAVVEARKSAKPLLVMHLSGNFAKSEFT